MREKKVVIHHGEGEISKMTRGLGFGPSDKSPACQVSRRTRGTSHTSYHVSGLSSDSACAGSHLLFTSNPIKSSYYRSHFTHKKSNAQIELLPLGHLTMTQLPNEFCLTPKLGSCLSMSPVPEWSPLHLQMIIGRIIC